MNVCEVKINLTGRLNRSTPRYFGYESGIDNAKLVKQILKNGIDERHSERD